MDINMTLIGEMIAFGLFVWFTMKFIWPPLIQAIEERQDTIAQGLAAAEKGINDLEQAKGEVGKLLAEAKTQAAALIDQAHKRTEQMIDQAKSSAREEGKRIKAGAQAEIEQEVNRAKERLRGQVASLAIAGAEKILQRSIDPKAHGEVLDRLVTEL